MKQSLLLARLSWPLSVCMNLSGLLIISLSLALTPEHHWSRDLVTELGIAPTSAGIVGFVYEHLLRSALLEQIKGELAGIVNTDAKRLGIDEIYEGRANKVNRVKLPDPIRSGRSEVLFMGLALYAIIIDHKSLLEEALARGCHVRFLMFNMNSSSASLLNSSLSSSDNLISVLKGSFSEVLHFAQRHSRTGLVEARLYDIVPTFGAVAIDRNESDGHLYIELNCYASSGEQCPGFKLRRQPGGLFYNYNRQINELWEAAKAPTIHSNSSQPGGGSLN
jgi:hypothetical protein